jgi:hypothetical protein
MKTHVFGTILWGAFVVFVFWVMSILASHVPSIEPVLGPEGYWEEFPSETEFYLNRDSRWYHCRQRDTEPVTYICE